MELSERELTEKENKLLADMDLSPRMRSAVQEVWKKEPFTDSGADPNFLWLKVAQHLVVLILGLNFLYPSSALTALTYPIAAIVWFLNIFMYLFGILAMVGLIMSNTTNPLGHGGMILWNKNSYLKNLYPLTLNLVMIALLALNGYVVTSVVATLTWLVGWLGVVLVRSVVDKALREAERTAQN